MESSLMVLNGVAWIVASVGIALSAVFIVWSGYLFISSQGDPQGIARARLSLIGVVIGIVIIGGAFIIPGTISRFVVEPAGGIPIDPRAAVDCDGILRTQLVFQRSANEAVEMAYIVLQVQNQNDACGADSWNPVVRQPTEGVPHGCRDGLEVGGVLIPETSLRVGGALVPHSHRDSDNNIIVYFVHPDETAPPSAPAKGLPSNGAVCWMYVAAFSAWSEGYRP